MNGDRRHNARIAQYVRELLREQRDERHDMEMKDDADLFDRDDTEEERMAKLHQRDHSNTATPIHRPIIQGVDYAASDMEPEEVFQGEGDGEFAERATEYIEAQEEAHADMDIEGRDPRFDDEGNYLGEDKLEVKDDGADDSDDDFDFEDEDHDPYPDSVSEPDEEGRF